jgi:hypothetical protein
MASATCATSWHCGGGDSCTVPPPPPELDELDDDEGVEDEDEEHATSADAPATIAASVTGGCRVRIVISRRP